MRLMTWIRWCSTCSMSGGIRKITSERRSKRCLRFLIIRSSGAVPPSIPSLSAGEISMAVLGISTNTRLVSVAVISEGRLAAYWTHLYKSSWSPQKRAMIIAGFEPCVRQYCITRVFLSIPSRSHQSPALKSLVRHLKQFFRGLGVLVKVVTPDAFASFCPRDRRLCKRGMMRQVVHRFPELRGLYLKELRNRHRYHFRVFHAVAAAMLEDRERS